MLFFVFLSAQKMKFSIKDFFGKCDQNRCLLWIWSHSLKKSLIGNFIFCVQFSSNEDGVQVIIVHSLALTQIIAVIGWIYFLAWSVSF